MNIMLHDYYDKEFDKMASLYGRGTIVILDMMQLVMILISFNNIVYKRNDSIIRSYCLLKHLKSKDWNGLGRHYL